MIIYPLKGQVPVQLGNMGLCFHQRGMRWAPSRRWFSHVNVKICVETLLNNWTVWFNESIPSPHDEKTSKSLSASRIFSRHLKGSSSCHSLPYLAFAVYPTIWQSTLQLQAGVALFKAIVGPGTLFLPAAASCLLEIGFKFVSKELQGLHSRFPGGLSILGVSQPLCSG